MPFSETVLLSRHVKTAEHHNYLTQVAITDVLDPSTPPPKAADAMGRSAQNFVVEVVVRAVTNNGVPAHADATAMPSQPL